MKENGFVGFQLTYPVSGVQILVGCGLGFLPIVGMSALTYFLRPSAFEIISALVGVSLFALCIALYRRRQSRLRVAMEPALRWMAAAAGASEAFCFLVNRSVKPQRIHLLGHVQPDRGDEKLPLERTATMAILRREVGDHGRNEFVERLPGAGDHCGAEVLAASLSRVGAIEIGFGVICREGSHGDEALLATVRKPFGYLPRDASKAN